MFGDLGGPEDQQMTERVELQFPDGRPALTAAADVNTALAEVGAGV